MSVNIKEYIDEYREILDAYIKKTFSYKNHDKALDDLHSVFRAAGGGKCIRGSLVKLGYEIAGGNSDERLLPISAAFEILQTSLLCHDDIIDCSPLRRGKPSIWKSIADEAGSYHYGISQAICLGDHGFISAINLISTSDFPHPVKLRALDLFCKVIRNTLDGEMLDVQMTEARDYGDEKRIIEIARLKTAFYTIIGPMQLGAVMGGKPPFNEKLLSDIESFGENLGIAFQIKDDILGISAEEREIGKSDMSDVIEGKVTLLIHYALENGNKVQRQKLKELYGKKDLTRDEKSIVYAVFKSANAFSDAERKAARYLEKANEVINKLTNNQDHQELLSQLSSLMVERKF